MVLLFSHTRAKENTTSMPSIIPANTAFVCVKPTINARMGIRMERSI